MSIEEVENNCLKRNVPFYCYRLPGTSEIIMGVQKDPVISSFSGFSQKDVFPGFVISPFLVSERSFGLFIKEDFRITDSIRNESIDSWLRTVVFKPEVKKKETITQSKKDYLENVSDLIRFLNNGDVSKVVYSRAFSVSVSSLNHMDIFRKLANRYPDAFVYYVYIPGQSVWIGASPEIFLCRDTETLKTVSLAGTKCSSDMDWTDKEYKEHEYVVRFIEEVFTLCKLGDYKKEGPDTVQAGDCFHLRTDFVVNREVSLNQIDRLVKVLHPTPAVCGYPQTAALNEILKREPYDREFYSGFLGPVSSSGKIDLFVNLRCLKIDDGKAYLYVGGGITKDSDPLDEWDETLLKSRTIELIINNDTD
jgi:isochorismate synthase